MLGPFVIHSGREGGAHEEHCHQSPLLPEDLLPVILIMRELASNANSIFCYVYILILCVEVTTITAHAPMSTDGSQFCPQYHEG